MFPERLYYSSTAPSLAEDGARKGVEPQREYTRELAVKRYFAVVLRVLGPVVAGGTMHAAIQAFGTPMMMLLDPKLVFFALLVRLYYSLSLDNIHRAEYLQQVVSVRRRRLDVLEQNDALLMQQFDTLRSHVDELQRDMNGLRNHLQINVTTVSRLRRTAETSVTELQQRLASTEADLARAVRRPPPVTLRRLLCWESPRTKLNNLFWFAISAVTGDSQPPPTQPPPTQPQTALLSSSSSP